MDVRTEILRTATRLFAAHGFDGTSLQDIADAVGIRKPSLLYHFPSKAALRLSVLDQVLDRWNDVLPRLLMAAAAGERRFDGVIREVVGFFTDDPDRARLLLRELLDRPEDMRGRLETFVRPWVAVVADLIHRGQQHGEIYQDVDAEAYVLQVINMVVSGVANASCLAGAVLPADSPLGSAYERHTSEMVRIARFSLFCTLHERTSERPGNGAHDDGAPITGAHDNGAPIDEGQPATDPQPSSAARR